VEEDPDELWQSQRVPGMSMLVAATPACRPLRLRLSHRSPELANGTASYSWNPAVVGSVSSRSKTLRAYRKRKWMPVFARLSC
jgi:hypothetical protein